MDYVLWEISHANLMMLMAAIPDYSSKKEDKIKKEFDTLDLLAQELKL
jgi:hypothetical protein